MLTINFNEAIKISAVSSGKKEDGTEWCLYTILESDQVEGSKSKSRIKCWGTKLAEGIQAGSVAKLTKLEGIRLVHAKIGEKYGNPIFRDEYHLTGCEFEPVEG